MEKLPFLRVKRGDKLAKILRIGPCPETACIVKVTGVRNRGQTILVDDETDVSAGVNSFNAQTGRALVDYVPGCSSRLMTIEAARAAGIPFEEDDEE